MNPAATAFPANFVWAISEALGRVDFVKNVVRRPIRPVDPNMTASIYASIWQPQQGGMEIGQEEPTLTQYDFILEYLVKYAGDEAEGHNVHSVGSKHIRAMLYRDEGLRLQLAQLDEVYLGTREQVKRIKLRRQRFFTNRTSRSEMIFLSAIDGFVETETQRL
jgi:hypothetical protein